MCHTFQVGEPIRRDGRDVQNKTGVTLSYCSYVFDLLVHVIFFTTMLVFPGLRYYEMGNT